MLRWLKRIAKAVILVVALVVAIPVLGLAYGYLTTDATAPSATDAAATPERLAIHEMLAAEIAGYQRPEESTYLTYPEWAIVYAAREYAGFVDGNSPSGFPYLAYVSRFWRDYAAMIRASSPYPFNFQNHLMLTVIGISHTVEHVIQFLYENTVGRLTGLAGYPTGEDRFLAAVAADYAAFLDQVPWYRFPYAEKRAVLWNIPSAGGLAVIRSWERKLGFSLALTIKQTYANLIQSGLAATSDPAALDIHVWAEGSVANAIAGEDDTALVRDLGAEGAVFVTKRYQVFTDMIPRLIERGLTFVEIGGNDEILLTVLSNEEPGLLDGARRIFSYALPTNPALVRTGLSVPVPLLHQVLPELENSAARLEHVYDY